jgi:predicted MFS family arabinose efflux permease
MVPQVLATIQSATQGQDRARAIGLYGATAGIAAVVGQVAGGFIVDANIGGADWRPIFLVNVPVGIAALALAWRSVPSTRAAEPAPIDALGTGLLAVAVLGLLVPVTEGRTLGWPLWSWALLALVLPALAAFALVERRLENAGRHPLVPPTLLRHRGMRPGLAIAMLFFGGFAAFLFVAAIAFQIGAGLSPLGSGLALMPMAVSFLAASLASAALTARLGRDVIAVGAILQAIGLVALGATLWSDWPNVDALTLALPMVVAGFGQGLMLSPLFGFVLAGVPAHRAGVGSGVLTTTAQSAQAIGVGTLGSLFLSLSAADSLGMRDAFVIVLTLQIAMALVVIAATRGLPDPAAARAEAAAGAPATEEAELVEAA